MSIDDYRQFSNLSTIPLTMMQPSDLLIKKIFPETAKYVVEKAIVLAQSITNYFDGRGIAGDGLFDPAKQVFKKLGSATSEHAAIVIENGNIAEAIEHGVITDTLKSRSHERYIVYRCHNPDLRKAVVAVATALATKRHGTIGGSYSLSGAIKSSVRDPQFQSNSLWNNMTSTPTAKYLDDILDYCQGVSNVRPDMFCSEFTVACYEAASVAVFGKTAFGSSPRAMSPIELENVINHRPDLMQLVGRFESPIDIVFEALKEGVEEYANSLTGALSFFRRPSTESLQALSVLKSLVAMGPTDYLFSAAEHYACVVSKVPYDASYRLDLITHPLKRDSKFFEILQTKLKGTTFFYTS
jgi:hypothetical protein